jgi:hypothetical protein
MLEKIKVRKIAVVIFLTLLIWVWADLALDTTKPFYNATISISKTAKPDLWISFNEKPSINIKQFALKGPVSKINQIEDDINNDPKKLDFTLVPEEMDINKSGSYVLSVRDILDKSDWIKDMGISVVEESCDPCEVNVNVVDLVPQDLTVQCFNENGELLKTETIEPQKVNMLVPRSWQGERLAARVTLSREDISKARSEIIEKTPQITLAPGQQPRLSATTVTIKMPPVADLRQEVNVKDPTLGYCFSPNLQGKYMVEVENLPAIYNIRIKATPAAKEAYEKPDRFEVILNIIDGDENKTDWIPREIIYNFPQEFSKDEIELVGPKVTARFRLKKISPPDNQ